MNTTNVFTSKRAAGIVNGLETKRRKKEEAQAEAARAAAAEAQQVANPLAPAQEQAAQQPPIQAGTYTGPRLRPRRPGGAVRNSFGVSTEVLLETQAHMMGRVSFAPALPGPTNTAKQRTKEELTRKQLLHTLATLTFENSKQAQTMRNMGTICLKGYAEVQEAKHKSLFRLLELETFLKHHGVVKLSADLLANEGLSKIYWASEASGFRKGVLYDYVKEAYPGKTKDFFVNVE